MNERWRGKDEVEDLCLWCGNLLLPTPSVPAGCANCFVKREHLQDAKLGARDTPAALPHLIMLSDTDFPEVSSHLVHKMDNSQIMRSYCLFCILLIPQ